MKFLAIEKEIPGVRGDGLDLLLKAEAARAWELYRSGLNKEKRWAAFAHRFPKENID